MDENENENVVDNSLNFDDEDIILENPIEEQNDEKVDNVQMSFFEDDIIDNEDSNVEEDDDIADETVDDINDDVNNDNNDKETDSSDNDDNTDTGDNQYQEKKEITVVSGNGGLDISPVYDHIDIEKPDGDKEKKHIIIPEEKK